MAITFLQLNVWHGTLLENALAFIKEERPDIINFQEVFDGPDETNADGWRFNTLSILKNELDWLPHCLFEPSLHDTSSDQAIPWGNATFSRFPLQPGKAVFYDYPLAAVNLKTSDPATSPRNLMYCTAQTPNKTFTIANTHGIWGTDGNDHERRLAMADTILRELGDKTPLILSGDFNVNEGTQTIAKLEAAWHSVFAQELPSTFNMAHKPASGNYATSVVDFIFTSADWTVQDHYVPGADVSDHRPLVVVLAD